MKQSTLLETQKLFRTLMNSMAAPGVTFSIKNFHPDPLIFQICETLLDNEVTFSVVGADVQESFINEIAFRTGSLYVDTNSASFVIVTGGSSDNALRNLNIGTLEYPENSSTVIYMVDNIETVEGVELMLSGPGIQNPFVTSIDGVPREEFETLANLNSNFPLGLDIIFCDEKKVLSLPRTVSAVPQ